MVKSRFKRVLEALFGPAPMPPTKPNPEIEYLTFKESSEEPWASFEVIDFEDGGRVKVKFNWNDEFIRRIRSIGFEAETEEDSVQLFFYASQLRPTELSGGDAPVNSEEHPTLSGQQNVLLV